MPPALSRSLARALFAPLLLGSIAISLAGCGGNEPVVTEEALSPDRQSGALRPDQKPVASGDIAIDAPTLYHNKVGIRAYAEGNRVSIVVRNMREEPFMVRPTNFAVIVKGQREPNPVRRGEVDFTLFPPVNLAPETSVAGRITWTRLGDLRGQRLVFRHPELGDPFFIEIEAPPAPPAESQPRR